MSFPCSILASPTSYEVNRLQFNSAKTYTCDEQESGRNIHHRRQYPSNKLMTVGVCSWIRSTADKNRTPFYGGRYHDPFNYRSWTSWSTYQIMITFHGKNTRISHSVFWCKVMRNFFKMTILHDYGTIGNQKGLNLTFSSAQLFIENDIIEFENGTFSHSNGTIGFWKWHSSENMFALGSENDIVGQQKWLSNEVG